MKIIKKIFLVLLLLFIVAQFFGPEKNQGNLASTEMFLLETNPPETVKLILKESCFDCHGSVTHYPWYNAITPVNYWLNAHIKEGKEALNFSKWEGSSVKRKDHKFEELIEMVEEREMPLPSYTWSHKEAKLTDHQIKAVVDWAELVRLKHSFIPETE